MRKNNYNDGVLNVYREKDRKTDFNAKKNVKTLDDLEWVVKLPFSEKNRRQQDYLFAEQMGTKLTMKVAVPYLPIVKNKQKVVIRGYMYDITYIDPDSDREEMFLYLEGVREIAE